jgi:hypothetical protein
MKTQSSSVKNMAKTGIRIVPSPRSENNYLGKIRGRRFEQQRYRARVLNLVTATIVLWNMVYLERTSPVMAEQGKPVVGELLQYFSPLGWEHINLTGDYVWRQSRRLEDGKFRPIRQLVNVSV